MNTDIPEPPKKKPRPKQSPPMWVRESRDNTKDRIRADKEGQIAPLSSLAAY
ncbi:MAG: hypothetical protein ABS980_33075 [Rhodococcus sp. (in: high G+C Gram-positive bacteria)]